MGQSKPIMTGQGDKLAEAVALVLKLPFSEEIQDVYLARLCRKWLEDHSVDGAETMAIDGYSFPRHYAEAEA